MAHWTEKNLKHFLYRIAADFVTQLETKMQGESLTKTDLAQKLGKSKSRVSQILNNPGNLSLKTIIELARVLRLKVALVAYDDRDRDNERGPINSDIFRICWENSGKPRDFWSLQELQRVATTDVTASLPLKIQVRNVIVMPCSHASHRLKCFGWSHELEHLKAWCMGEWLEAQDPVSQIDELQNMVIRGTASQNTNMIQ